MVAAFKPQNNTIDAFSGAEAEDYGISFCLPIVIALMKFHAIYVASYRRCHRWSSSPKEFCANFFDNAMTMTSPNQSQCLLQAGLTGSLGATSCYGWYLGAEGRALLMHVYPVYYYQHFLHFSLWRILFLFLFFFFCFLLSFLVNSLLTLKSTCRRYNVSKLLKCFVRNFKQFFGGSAAAHNITNNSRWEPLTETGNRHR